MIVAASILKVREVVFVVATIEVVCGGGVVIMEMVEAMVAAMVAMIVVVVVRSKKGIIK